MPRLSRATLRLMLATFAVLPLAACAGQGGGLTIYNTSNHDVSFTQRVPGGEKSYTLHPGSKMEMGSGAKVNLGEFSIVAD